MPINFDVTDLDQEPNKFAKEAAQRGMLMPSTNIMDIDVAKARFGAITGHIDLVLDRVDRIEVKTEKEQYEVTEISVQAKTLLKELDLLRKSVIEKPYGFFKAINGWVKQFSDRLESVVKKSKKKLDDYAYLEIVKKRDQDRKMAEETARRQAEIDKAAKKADIPKDQVPQLPTQKVNKIPAPVRTESGSATVRMVWIADLEDESKVPRKYMAVDMKKVDQAVKAGIREIPGFNIHEVADTRFRRH